MKKDHHDDTNLENWDLLTVYKKFSSLIEKSPIKAHSSEKRGLHSTFWPIEMLQNLLCLCKKKTQVVFFVFHFKQIWVLPYEWPRICQDRPGHS